MLFNSYSFLVFLSVVLPVSRWISNWSVRKSFLLAISYVFYAAWNPPFVLLLIFSTILDWYLAQALGRVEHPTRRKLLLITSLLVNLGLLAYFKYGNFALESFTTFVNAAGIPYQPLPMSIILPIGISFYTFETISYILDVYRREMRPWHSFLDYALYVTFFPHLVAGPILRAPDFLGQCATPKKGSRQQIGWGLSLFVIGLFYKMVVADNLVAAIVEKVFDSVTPVGFVDAWVGTFAFAIQIYSDFAGYSLCAIGIALCFGFVFPTNFRFPYASIGFSDFWRRWHITLSTWLRDYLYISLGGNRYGVAATYRNLMLTMVLGGFWHGASWMFVIWGALHGLYLVAERVLRQQRWAQNGLWQPRPVQFSLALITFLLVCVAWVFFRATELDRAVSLVGAMLYLAPPLDSFLLRNDVQLVLILTVAFLVFEWTMRDKSFEWLASQLPQWMIALLLAGMLFLIAISFVGVDRAFIYFQF